MPDNEFTQRRLTFIDDAERNLISGVSDLDVELWKRVRELTEKIRTEEGRITSSAANYSLLGELNKIGREIKDGEKRKLIGDVVDDLIKQGDLVKMYFNKFLELERTGIQRKVHKELLYRIGYDGKGFVDRGVLFDLYNDDSPIRQVKAMTVKAIASGKAFKEFVDDMEGFVLGDENKLGVTSAHLLTATRDVFAQNDRSLTKQYADELGLDKFIFSGGLMRTTRDFCRQRNGKIFTRKEIESWKDLDFDGKPAGYSPFYDVGGYNCRHVLDPISDEVAQELQDEAGGDPVVVPPGPVKPEPKPASEQIADERKEDKPVEKKKPAPKKTTTPTPAQDEGKEIGDDEFFPVVMPSSAEHRQFVKQSREIEKANGITRTDGKIDRTSILGKPLDLVESVIRDQTFESAAVYKTNGEQTLYKNGKKTQVEFTRVELEAAKGQIMTHNHPGSGSFSPADLQVMTKYELHEIRAVGNLYTYSVKPGRNLSPSDNYKIEAKHNTHVRDAASDYEAIVKSKRLATQEKLDELKKSGKPFAEIKKEWDILRKKDDEMVEYYYHRYTHEAMLKTAKTFGLIYKRTRR